jgi:hypothetical protein
VVPDSDWEFKILEDARIENAKEIASFVEAVVAEGNGPMLMFPYAPSIGFRCLSGRSELFSATIDLRSNSMEAVFPDGQRIRRGIDVASTRAILTGKGLSDNALLLDVE